MQRLEVSGAVRPIYRSLGVKGLREIYTGCFIMFSVITNIYNKKINGPTLMELFTATGKLISFDN